MKYLYLLFFILLFNSDLLSGQVYQRCSTMEHYEFMVNEGFTSENLLQKLNRETEQWLDYQSFFKSNSIMTIPVVFHVVHYNSGQNIPDSKILAQLDVLNKDFSRKNSDTTRIEDVFKNFGADTRIRFCLADRDPSGNPTTGITRTPTARPGFSYTTNDMKFTAKGGKDIWDRDRYLNIWIVNFTDNTLGFAQFPGDSASTDGIVVHYGSVGGPGTPGIIPNYNLGRTATHEVGHWLGLYHTFQDGCAGNSLLTCYKAGDHICDTPPVINANFGCPTTKSTCIETPADLPDMTTNYMDYTDDACMNIFTNGQASRMQAVINNHRRSFLNTVDCQATLIEIYDNDVVIFPNPSTGSITISTSFEEATDLNIQIYNVLGKQVFAAPIENQNQTTATLELGMLPNGVYIAYFNSGKITVKKKIILYR
jgi:hypothetical protein